ncbi:MAG: DNA polymerase III subunit chi [Pseudomonadota bacterium]
MPVGEAAFYHLTRATLDQALPSLLEKVVERGVRAVLVVRDPERRKHLDQWLWTYRPDSFLPHGADGSGFPERQPVWLAGAVANPNGASVLLTVDGLMPPADAPFERCLDLFDGTEEAAVAAARERWKVWRERGVRLVYWQQRPEGGWQKAREEGGHAGSADSS